MDKVQMIQNVITILEILTAVWVLCGLIYIGITGKTKATILRAYENVCMHARNSSKGFFDYERWENYLRIHGASYYYGAWMNPVTYMALCIIIGLLGLTTGCSSGLLIGLLCAIVGAFLPGILLQYLDKKDNERMLVELDLVYSALSIQIRAGVYITDALAECYGSVTHERLRDALQNLSGDIVMKADLDQALEKFQGYFRNRYIDSLCITILQATESGQAVELLGDIAEQIKDMEITLQHKKKEQLNRSATFYQLGIFALILVLVLYACVSHMFSTPIFFG
ncbi:MAG: type II secretion system F family protein [Lachnospiraceae bacterium]|nr:type II secretion system F family protein [Lachnospiraceae bacterium]